MKTLIALAGSLVVAGSASATLTDMYFTEIDNGNPDYTTYRVYASFDNPNDEIGAYAGLEGQPLMFSTNVGTGLYNFDGLFGGGHTDDIPFGSEPPADWDLDSWLTIGLIGGFAGHPSFSPDFLGVPGGENLKVIADGMTGFSDTNSAVFFPGPAVPVSTWGDPANVALANFTVASELASEIIMDFAAVIQWVPEGGQVTQTYMEAHVPGPGALALLGLAGLLGRRRR